MYLPIKILILDDHSLFSEGLGEILKNHLVDVSVYKLHSIKDLRANFTNLNSFSLLISDIELPGEDIFGFLKGLKRTNPELPVLVISMHNKLSVIKKCKKLQVQGYILKDDQDLIITAVETLLSGESYYSARVQETYALLDKKENLLTPREEDIIRLVANGKTNQQISESLTVSINTITTHRRNINQKLNISNVAELIKYYFEHYIH